LRGGTKTLFSSVARSQKKAQRLARVLPGAGHLSSGILHLTLGLLTILFAVGLRLESPDARLAILALREQPFGPALLLLIGLGYCALVLFRLLQATDDFKGKRGWRIAFYRLRYFGGAILCLGLPLLVARILLGISSKNGEQAARELVAHVLKLPFGWTMIVGTGLACVASGGFYFWKMFRGNFSHWLHLEQMTQLQCKVCFALGRLGFAVRGFILLVTGWMVTGAGWNLNPGDIHGQAGVLNLIFHRFGSLALSLIAVGFFALGIFSFISMRFGKTQVSLDRIKRLVGSC
jgi:hypothetical protein